MATVGVVLAAGESKRLKSARPKVVHRVAGRAVVAHVVDAVASLSLDRIIVVVAPSGEGLVQEALEGAAVDYAIQKEPFGTGDAVRSALDAHPMDEGRVLVVPGDGPLITADTLDALLRAQEGAAAALFTAELGDPSGFGRILRNGDSLTAIVEEKDATDEQRAVTEVNAGAYVFDAVELRSSLDEIDRDNAQAEYYLTDVVGLLVAAGKKVVTVGGGADEALGVNSRADLAAVTAAFRRRICARLMASGVTIVDPATTYVDASVTVERDVTILPGTMLEGATVIREGAEVGPHARIVDSEVGAGASVSFAVVRGSTIAAGASVGPFSSVRPGTTLGTGGRIGSFVETKSSRIGDNSKIPHLSYVGDAEIGTGVNVGAGTITCNWDGQGKHVTVIDDDAYIGSDTMLVAPVRIGKRAATGAGSVVRGDVPDDALAVGVPARVLPGRGDRMGRSAPDSVDPGGVAHEATDVDAGERG